MIYTIVRPGGMERPQDDYKVTHNVALSPRDTLFGGQVSRLQVAELIAASVANTELAENKVTGVHGSNVLLYAWSSSARAVGRLTPALRCAALGQVLEVVAETENPLRSYEELLRELPTENPQAERIAAAQAAETALQQLEAAREKVRAHFICGLSAFAMPRVCSERHLDHRNLSRVSIFA